MPQCDPIIQLELNYWENKLVPKNNSQYFAESYFFLSKIPDFLLIHLSTLGALRIAKKKLTKNVKIRHIFQTTINVLSMDI